MNKDVISKFSKKQIAMFGAMLGDAMGVPHEFKSGHRINADFIDHPLTISDEYKTYNVPLGVYSDDFSQQLCVEQHFRGGVGTVSSSAFYRDLIEWRKGKYWVDDHKFDEGNQTAQALQFYEKKGMVLMNEPHQCGNGSLMRVLPVAFSNSTESEMQAAAFLCSSITHNNADCVNSCVFYVQLVRELIAVIENKKTLDVWFRTARKVQFDPYKPKYDAGNGGVIDSMCVLKDVIWHATSYADAIKRAIMIGGDTDTNACIVGGIAALWFGLDDLPEEWITFIQPSMQNQYVKQLFTV